MLKCCVGPQGSAHSPGHHPEAISPSNQARCSLESSSSPHIGYREQLKLKPHYVTVLLMTF